jgi:hypothetical protein
MKNAGNVTVRRTWVFVLLALAVFGVLNRAFYVSTFGSGYLHPEAEAMLLNYTDGRDLLNKIFDPRWTDWGYYQARELSYLVDYLDYNFISISIRSGVLHFLSLSTYLGILLMALLLVGFFRKRLALDKVTSILLLLLFLTSSSIITAGAVFRSAKIGVGVSLIGMLSLLYKRYQTVDSQDRVDYFLIFLWSLAAILFDRQGVFIVGATILVLATLHRSPDFNRWKCIGALAIASAVGIAYNFIIAPALILHFSGYSASFGYQELPLRTFILALPYFLLNGFYLFLGNLKYTLGNNDLLLAAMLLACFVYIPVSVHRAGGVRAYLRDGALALQHFAIFVSALLVLMNSLMFLRHPPLAWIDVQRVYYWIPCTVIIIFGLALISREMISEYGHRPIWFLLTAMVCGNVLCVPEHFQVLRNGHLQGYMSAYQQYSQVIRLARDPLYEIQPEIRQRPLGRWIERELRQNPEFNRTPPTSPL